MKKVSFPTTAEIHAQTVKDLTEHLAKVQATISAERAARVLAQDAEKAAREQFNDLKQRLVRAEGDNQYMRGYVARVQEDDVVREELVVTGDPDGQSTLVPKRKPTFFQRPEDTTRFDTGTPAYGRYSDERPQPKHWVTY